MPTLVTLLALVLQTNGNHRPATISDAHMVIAYHQVTDGKAGQGDPRELGSTAFRARASWSRSL
jgi:hypothetical protein